MNYIDNRHVKAYQGMIGADMHAGRGHSRRAPLRGLRRALASTLVLTGARLMPETPAFVGDRVLVFDRQPIADADGELQPAA